MARNALSSAATHLVSRLPCSDLSSSLTLPQKASTVCWALPLGAIVASIALTISLVLNVALATRAADSLLDASLLRRLTAITSSM